MELQTLLLVLRGMKMDIQNIVVRNYLLAAEVTEKKAQEFPGGSKEHIHWLRIADVYRRLAALDQMPATEFVLRAGEII